MPLVKVGARHQITIPKEIVEELRLKPGDYVEVDREGERIVIIPKAIIDRQDAWFWSEEWQEKEREADQAIAKGEVIGPFESTEQALKALKKAKL